MRVALIVARICLVNVTLAPPLERAPPGFDSTTDTELKNGTEVPTVVTVMFELLAELLRRISVCQAPPPRSRTLTVNMAVTVVTLAESSPLIAACNAVCHDAAVA